MERYGSRQDIDSLADLSDTLTRGGGQPMNWRHPSAGNWNLPPTSFAINFRAKAASVTRPAP